MFDCTDISTFDPTDPASFAVWSTERIRWGDQDSMGHVNNASVARYAETGRIHYAERAMDRILPKRTMFTLARVAIDFRLEMRYPGEVRIGSRVSRVGRSSFRLIQGLFTGDTCAANTEAVMVLIDLDTRRSVPISDDLRYRLLHPHS